MRRFLLATFAFTTLATLVSGCPAEERKEEDDGRPESITISPAAPSVVVGSALQLTATAHYADGSTQNVTEDTLWEMEDPTVATVDDEGLVLTLTTGESDLTATYQFRVAEIELAVIPVPPPTFFESEPNDDPLVNADNFTGFGTFEGTCDFGTDPLDYFTAIVPAGTFTWDPLESTCRHASLSIL